MDRFALAALALCPWFLTAAAPPRIAGTCSAVMDIVPLGSCECGEEEGPGGGATYEIWWSTTFSGADCAGCTTSWTFTAEDENGAVTGLGNGHESADCDADTGLRHYIQCPCNEEENWIAFQAGCSSCS